jgi:hypothetical protein
MSESHHETVGAESRTVEVAALRCRALRSVGVLRWSGSCVGRPRESEPPRAAAASSKRLRRIQRDEPAHQEASALTGYARPLTPLSRRSRRSCRPTIGPFAERRTILMWLGARRSPPKANLFQPKSAEVLGSLVQSCASRAELGQRLNERAASGFTCEQQGTAFDI